MTYHYLSFILLVVVCLHWPRLISRPRLIAILTELGLMIMLGSGYSAPKPCPMQIPIGSVHNLSGSAKINYKGNAFSTLIQLN